MCAYRNAAASLAPQLRLQTLYKGGDVSDRQLLLLHDVPELDDSARVSEGLYCTTNFVRLRETIEAQQARGRRSSACHAPHTDRPAH